MHQMPKNLLLIPSQLCTARVWQHQIEHLSDGARTRIHVADHRGHPRMEDIARDILRSAPAEFALVAHGMGGFIALQIMRDSPLRVTRLALLGTLAEADGAAQRQRRQGYAHLVEQGRFEEVIDERIPILFHPDRQSDTALLEIARRMAHETGPEAFLRQQQAIMDRQDSRPLLGTIRCPTLVINGRQDAISTPAQAAALADGIPGARLEMLEECGHLSPLERAAAVTRLLRDWLADPE